MRSDMKRVVAALIGSLTLAGCGGAKAAGSATAEQAAEAKYSDITAHQLHQKMQAKDFVLVNVHVPYAGDISTTVSLFSIVVPDNRDRNTLPDNVMPD